VPVQTGERVAQVIAREARPEADWEVASNPEFLREGSAVVDTLDPDRWSSAPPPSGAWTPCASSTRPILDALGRALPGYRPGHRRAIKHASNAFLATKISFINSVARVCERSGADVEPGGQGHGPDPRIGVHFLKGRRRLRAAAAFPQGRGPPSPTAPASWASTSAILNEVAKINHDARRAVVDKVRDALWHLDGKRIGMLGPVVQAQHRRLREAPSIRRGPRPAGRRRPGGRLRPGGRPSLAVRQVPGLELADKAARGRRRRPRPGPDDPKWASSAELDPVDPPGPGWTYPILVDARNALDAEAFVAAGFTVAGVGPRPVRGPRRREPLTVPRAVITGGAGFLGIPPVPAACWRGLGRRLHGQLPHRPGQQRGASSASGSGCST
jgi:UDPglucose 6-dehydrogenase